MTIAQLSSSFFLQMAVIIIACRVIGWLAHRYLGQPQVVGEMIAGVVLGPSIFGALAPQMQAMIFPVETKPILYVGAQLGVGLYMFIVGMEFDRQEFRASARSAAAVSMAGMLVPFLAAALLIPGMMGTPGLFAPHVSAWQATLFLGSAIAITAFPMLARIIHERGISGTKLGTLSLSAGAIGDAGAWAVIALVLASLGAGPIVAIKAVGGGLAFAFVMVVIAPRYLKHLGTIAERENDVSGTLLAICLILFLLSAYAMDSIGIHAVFGGFLLGTAMPRGALVKGLRTRLEPFATVFLLPIFFTYSGLNTEMLVVDTPSLIGIAILVLLVSILAKGGACYVAARLSGQDHPTAIGIGVLMNARGLMELIIINIGLERGIIGAPLFAMLALMAIVSTLMASPLFELTNRKKSATGTDTTMTVH
ncbi:cation:proton antiporter [Aquisediminimonas sediminicola]|uniref:cation:proton antiporter n=1 Tax=Alteraquisediminimonas sediminicola TaxID=2676787 RepID=UPI001C8D7381|nr:cation:proton antiporter [Aquisediminimonas sediminicola]